MIQRRRFITGLSALAAIPFLPSFVRAGAKMLPLPPGRITLHNTTILISVGSWAELEQELRAWKHGVSVSMDHLSNADSLLKIIVAGETVLDVPRLPAVPAAEIPYLRLVDRAQSLRIDAHEFEAIDLRADRSQPVQITPAKADGKLKPDVIDWSGIKGAKFSYLCINASHWEMLPTAIQQMQESINSRMLTPLPTKDDLAGFQEKNLIEIRVGETYPMECALRIGMV